MLSKTEDNCETKRSDTLVVYLILAHGDPELLDRQIHALDNEEVRFFVHIDAKSDLNHFKTSALAKDNVTLITDRVKVFWGGFSMVEATLRLMEAAIAEVPTFKYAILLSGVHYPIKSNDYILDMLRNSDSEYLQYAKVSEVGCEFKVNAFCLYDYKLFNQRAVYFRDGRLNELAKIPGKFTTRFFRKLVPLVYKRTLAMDVVPYTGANWWALTKGCVEYVLKYVRENRRYMNYFRFAYQPDETFFHTIICNAHFKLANKDISLGSMAGHDSRQHRYSRLRGLSLTFTKCAKGGNPKVLDESDFPDIRKELNYCGFPQLFARKFDIERSAALLRLIDDFRKTDREYPY